MLTAEAGCELQQLVDESYLHGFMEGEGLVEDGLTLHTALVELQLIIAARRW